MHRIASLAVVLAAGCSLHAGPTLAWRSRGAVAVGWDSGFGVAYGQVLTEAVVGQSYVRGGGRPFSYGGLSFGGFKPIGELNDGSMTKLELARGTIGGGVGDRGGGVLFGLDGGLVVGKDTANGRDDFDDVDLPGVQLLAGVRLVGSELELYVSPQLTLFQIVGDSY